MNLPASPKRELTNCELKTPASSSPPLQDEPNDRGALFRRQLFAARIPWERQLPQKNQRKTSRWAMQPRRFRPLPVRDYNVNVDGFYTSRDRSTRRQRDAS